MRSNMIRAVAVVLVTAFGASIGPGAIARAGQGPEGARQEQARTAPEFPAGLEWLNTERPLALRELRGKVVLLDFWTYCCINCMHIIPDLKRLEAKYPNELVVIGVHSAKFTAEGETDNIRQAILRYELHHPVINDREFEVWKEYGAEAWPTLVLIGPDGKIVGTRTGEGVYEPVDRAIAELVAKADATGTLDRRPLALRLEKDRAPDSVLSFPGKVLADAPGRRLFVADTNHNRVVVASLDDGSVLDVIGGGPAGLVDGAFDKAAFFHPQGLALDGDALYVADTENHAIRRASLSKRTVETLVGTGKQAENGSEGGVGTAAALNSPWDLTIKGGALFVAMAGSHQIWRVDPATARAEVYAGTGREDRVDGPLDRAALAQPSGVTTDGSRLFVADSEVSSIRTIDLNAKEPTVGTVVGKALFEFGDRDGVGDEVRLQHPLGVAFGGGSVYVADTYNSKIKRVYPRTHESVTLAGAGTGGLADGVGRAARFDEPGGLSYAAGKLYVADTNNNAIRVVDASSGRVSTFAFRNLERLAEKPDADKPFGGQVVELAEQRVAPGAGRVVVDLTLPAGYALNEAAPFFAGLATGDASAVAVPAESAGKTRRNPTLPLVLAVDAKTGRTVLNVDMVVYYCETAHESVCLVKPVRLRLPLVVADGAPSEVRVPYTPPAR